MVAVTAIQDESGADGTKIHLYYNLANKNIGFQFRNEHDTSDIKLNTFVPDDKAHEGIVIYQSHLASTKHYNKELVFAVTEPKDTEKKACHCGQPTDTKDSGSHELADPVDISLISPVYKVVTSAYNDNYKIAACSSNVNTWIYYLKKNPKANNALNIFEAVIGPTNDKAFSSTPPILQGSGLAAYWDAGTKKQNVIYQGADDKKLRQYVIGGADAPIDAAKGVKAKSTLAIAVTDTKAFLYFVDADNSTITRVTKKVGGTKWGHEQTVSDADPITPDSQLSVTVAAGANHLFYKAENSPKGELTHVVDSWEDDDD